MLRHHAYFFAGDLERGIEAALAFGERELSLSASGNPDVVILRYGLCSVEDARTICDIASRTALSGGAKLIIVAAGRLFHEAQNALLKTFEEPPAGTYLMLVVPTEGNIIPTLRSRMMLLPSGKKNENTEHEMVTAFLKGTTAVRKKIVENIVLHAKSDDADEKQAARIEALALVEGLSRAAYRARTKAGNPEYDVFLSDSSRLIPILHERSAPLKPILEHLLLVMPKHLIQ